MTPVGSAEEGRGLGADARAAARPAQTWAVAAGLPGFAGEAGLGLEFRGLRGRRRAAARRRRARQAVSTEPSARQAAMLARKQTGPTA